MTAALVVQLPKVDCKGFFTSLLSFVPSILLPHRATVTNDGPVTVAILNKNI